jgi:hypothetical protein
LLKVSLAEKTDGFFRSYTDEKIYKKMIILLYDLLSNEFYDLLYVTFISIVSQQIDDQEEVDVLSTGHGFLLIVAKCMIHQIGNFFARMKNLLQT